MNVMRIKSTLPFFLLFVSVTVLSAQWNMVQETQRNMSFGSRPAFRLEFANTDAGTLEDSWREYVKTVFGGKLKKDKKTGEWTATGLKSNMMDGDVFGIYSTIEKDDKGSVLTAWFDAGSYFLSRRDNPGRTEEIAGSLRQFYFDVRRAAIGKEMKEQEAKLKEMESRQKKLQRENETLRRDIETYKARIKKAEEDLVKNEKDQESNIIDSDGQRRLIEEVRRRLDNVENERN